MNIAADPSMGKILALTKAGKLSEATALIKRSLSGSAETDEERGETVMREARRVVPVLPGPNAKRADFQPSKPQPKPARSPAGSGKAVRGRYQGKAASLDYLLYTPEGAEGPLPVVVMLHGCTQSADDFALGTGMNALAQELGFIVVYPEQTAAANQQKCWNWFREGDQRRDSGEPELIAGLTREILERHGGDAERVYVAGLSAGGAAAAIMAATYPDIFAAAGIHSGLACGSARDLPGAFAAMQGKGRKRAGSAKDRFVPVITFHGDRDKTVHPSNSAQIHAANAAAPQLSGAERKVENGVSDGGRKFRRVSMVDAKGTSLAEDWTVAGAGHAWSGGSTAGSYTDAKGPDASREMMRFFLQHRRKG